jgi:hypothetical protein
LRPAFRDADLDRMIEELRQHPTVTLGAADREGAARVLESFKVLRREVQRLNRENEALTADVAAKHSACVEHRRLQRMVHLAPSDQTVGELRVRWGRFFDAR